MSILVLNSKGEDPEDFSNYMTENIEFPANAEVCLVGSHINRKLMVPKEVSFSVHGNRLHFQYGHGGTFGSGREYTPHSSYQYEFHNKAGIWPVKANTYGEIEATSNGYLNSPEFTPISPLCGGWANDIGAGTDLFTLFNSLRYPDRAQSDGSTLLKNIFQVPGATNKNPVLGAFNDTATPVATDSVNLQGAGPYANWVGVESLTNKVTNYIDVEPLFNTDNGARAAVFATLPSTTNIQGGGYHWQFTIVGNTVDDITGLRGGIIASGGEIINPNKGDAMNGTNSTLNKLSNNTDFSCWWQVTRSNPATGACTIAFYKRPIQPPGKKGYSTQMDGAIKWGQVALTASTESQRVGIRPINNGAGEYRLEGYGVNVTTATNAIQGITLAATDGGAAGYVTITDPRDSTIAEADKFNLYRHLPIFQGVTCPRSRAPGTLNVTMNAIHHNETHSTVASVAQQTASLPFTFGFKPLDLEDQIIEKFDAQNYAGIRRAQIGYALGYSSAWLRQTALLMLPAGTGAVAEIPINSTIPIAHSLVVSLPNLPISGFFGNSTGTNEAGTLGINSGGTSAPIIGVIPFGTGPLRTSDTAGFQNGDSGWAHAARGSWYAAPMENWIKLKNPSAFKVSSLRVKLTDELGTKPDILAGNTTITIKIKAPAVGDVDRGLTIQGN